MNRTRSRILAQSLPVVALAACLLLLVGCSGAIVGKWRLERAIPNQEEFAIRDAEFTDDGRYSGEFTFEGRTQRQSGRYSFTGFKLILTPDTGGQRAYTAAKKLRTLELGDGARKLILRKAD